MIRAQILLVAAEISAVCVKVTSLCTTCHKLMCVVRSYGGRLGLRLVNFYLL